jgi:hypothetical protein
MEAVKRAAVRGCSPDLPKGDLRQVVRGCFVHKGRLAPKLRQLARKLRLAAGAERTTEHKRLEKKRGLQFD